MRNEAMRSEQGTRRSSAIGSPIRIGALVGILGSVLIANARAQDSVQHLAAGDSKLIDIPLNQDEALDLDAQQIAGQIAVKWRSPDGEESPPLYTLDGVQGHVRVAIVASRAGDWLITITTRRGRSADYHLESSVHPARAEDQERARATVALGRGEALRAQSAERNASAAEQSYAEAIEASESAQDPCAVRAALNGLGHLQISLGRYEDAGRSSERALAATCEDPPSRAHALRIGMSALQWRGDLDATVRLGDEALQIYRATGDHAFEGLILGNLGGAYDQQGETHRAMEVTRQALDLARETGDLEGIVFDEETIGGILVQRGEYQAALEQFGQTLEDLKTHKSPTVEAMVEDDLASVYAALGEYPRALAEVRLSERTAHANANPSTEFDALMDEGNLRLVQHQYRQANQVFTYALGLAEQQSLIQKRARALRGIGSAEAALGQPGAMHRLLEAQTLALEAHDDAAQADISLALGDFYFAMRQFAQARMAYEQLRALAEHSLSTAQLAKAWASLARVDVATGNLVQARREAESALAMIDSERGEINPPQLRSRFFQSTRSYYDLYISILMALYRRSADSKLASLAFEAAENSRARALTELLSEHAVTQKSDLDPTLVAKRDAAQDALHAAAFRLARSNSDREQVALEKAVMTASASLDDVEGEIRRANARYGGVVRPQPLNLAAMQRDWMDEKTVLLEYWLSANESYLWVLTKHDLRSIRLPARGPIDAKSQLLRTLLATWARIPPGLSFKDLPSYRSSLDDQIRRRASELGELVLKGIGKTLRRENIVIVPDGSLCRLPFDILSADLADAQRSVDYLPSLASLRWLRRGPYRSDANPSLAVFADPVFSADDPRLKHAAPLVSDTSAGFKNAMRDARAFNLNRLSWSRREAEAIANDLSVDRRWVALDFAASREAVMHASWGAYDTVHFATHAIIDLENPQLSGVVLSLFDDQGHPRDGFLRVTDVYSLSMPAQLVVLSTCDSAADTSGSGNDAYTLANAFFYAGTPRVLGSLWAVDDEAAATFMRLFYRSLLLERQTPQRALSSAQHAMAAQSRWSSAYYWSAFVLQGDWQ
jgi:CHAT domain-containing protein/tetratricopeptide (TPR) repeat protein